MIDARALDRAIRAQGDGVRDAIVELSRGGVRLVVASGALRAVERLRRFDDWSAGSSCRERIENAAEWFVRASISEDGVDALRATAAAIAELISTKGSDDLGIAQRWWQMLAVHAACLALAAPDAAETTRHAYQVWSCTTTGVSVLDEWLPEPPAEQVALAWARAEHDRWERDLALASRVRSTDDLERILAEANRRAAEDRFDSDHVSTA